MENIYCQHAGMTSNERIGPMFFSQQRISMCYYKSVIPINIYPLCHNARVLSSFTASLFLWLTKRREITKEVLINNDFSYVLCYANDQMHVNMIISVAAIKIINKSNVIKSSHGNFMFKIYMCSWAIICQYNCCQNHYQACVMIDC